MAKARLAASASSIGCRAFCASACRSFSEHARRWTESSAITSGDRRRPKHPRCLGSAGCSSEKLNLDRGCRVVSVKHPIISVTGSSGAGTTSVRRTFEQIFRREAISASFIEGDAFHRYDRAEMKRVMNEEGERGNRHFSHFGPQANLLAELEETFRQYSRNGSCRTRHYIHDAQESKQFGAPPGTFTDWEPIG